MKTSIHPEYKQLEITCACGAVLASKSTHNVIRLDICSACHPFYTGTQRLMDTEGRVERFMKKYAKK